MKLVILSPVHIGDGEEIIPWEYAIENKHIKIFTVEKIISELNRKFYGNKLRSLLLDLRNELKNSKFHKNFGDFLRERNINIEEDYKVENRARLKSKGEYKSIKSFIKAGKKVYIPGSEVKGALRTVFIFGVVYKELEKGNSKLYNDIRKIIENALKKSEGKSPKERQGIWKRADEEISRLIFRNGAPKDDKGDAKYDIFKAVYVSDSDMKNPSECIYIDDIKLVGSGRQFFEPHELLKEGMEFNISIQIDENVKKALKKVYENPYMDYLTLENLKEFSYKFYRSLYNVEKEFFSRKGIDVKGLEDIKSRLEKEDFLLRIGKHQGFLSLTIMLTFYINKEEFYKEVYKSVVQRAGKEVNKTRKLTSENKLLGWVILK